MRLQTKHLWNDFWRSLYSDQHTWQNQSEFSDWIQDQGEVDSGSNETWITKEQQDELWGPDNCRLVNVWSNSDFNKILAGAFKQGGDHEYL